MGFYDSNRAASRSSVIVFLLVSSIVLVSLPSLASASTVTGPSTLPSTTFVPAPPAGAKGPDDITLMATPGLDGGQEVIWTAWQNGVQPNGTAGSAGGPTQSTVAGYDLATGAPVKTIQVTGKVDGLTADTVLGKLIATVNEDEFSAFNLIDPATGAVTTYKYSPDPAASGNGGTDSIAVWQGLIFVAHSNPNDTTQAADYLVNLDESTLTANLTPAFYDDSEATNALTGATVKLALTDPDTNFVLGSDLVTISQADGEVIFDSNLGPNPQFTVLPLADNKPGNAPPIDGFAVATSDKGTLYVVDGAKNTYPGSGHHGMAHRDGLRRRAERQQQPPRRRTQPVHRTDHSVQQHLR